MNEDFEKEILKIWDKYGKQMLKDCKGMSVPEERKYIEKWQPIVDKEVDEVIKKYKKKMKDEKKYNNEKNKITMNDIKVCDIIETKDGRVGIILAIYTGTTGLVIEFEDNAFENEVIDVKDVKRIVRKV